MCISTHRKTFRVETMCYLVFLINLLVTNFLEFITSPFQTVSDLYKIFFQCKDNPSPQKRNKSIKSLKTI